MQKVRKGTKRQQGRLKNLQGEVVSSEHRADTLADYLEHIQWKVRPASLTPNTEDPLHDELPVRIDAFEAHELEKAIQKSKMGSTDLLF